MNLLGLDRRTTTTVLMTAIVLSISGSFSIIGFVDAAPCRNCGADGGAGDGGNDGGPKGCRYNGFTYSDGDIVRTPGGGQMKCEDGRWMGMGIGYQG
jgi:hypothetical protein